MSLVAAKGDMTWRQDLSPAQLLSIDVENIDSPKNLKFKIPTEEALAIRKH